MEDVVYISHYVRSTRVLGPYERSAFWTRGCPFDCEGCLSPEMREPGGDAVDCERLAGELAAAGTEGVTVSGGEPFAQAAAVALVISYMREIADRGVIVYTGYTFEELSRAAERDPGVAALLGGTDVLIDGRYVAGLDDGRPYRGSANQRVLCLSDRYADVFDSYYNAPHGRRVEINLGPGWAELTGVPSRPALEAWRRLLAAGSAPQSRRENNKM